MSQSAPAEAAPAVPSAATPSAAQPPAGGGVRLADFLCLSLYSTSHAFTRVYKPLLDELGLTYPQYLAMTALWDADDQTVGALGEKLFLESSTLTPLLKRLEAMGHVTRARDPEDERQVRIRLTPQGAALREPARAIPARILAATGLTVEEARRLQGEICAVRDRLEGEG